MFSSVIKILPHRIQPVFQHMDEALQNTLTQIHLKAGARVVGMAFTLGSDIKIHSFLSFPLKEQVFQGA